MALLTIRTAAKVNLCLRVLGRRADGYHEVETVLHTVGIWDEITLRDTDSSQIMVSVAEGSAPQGEENLCWRAASLLAERTGARRGAAIAIIKGIPLRSGLGGGSSDAAATLAGLARLWELSLHPDELEAIAAEVGADVPFFLRGGCCLARGRGEKLTPCPELAAWLVIIAPERGVSTAQAYAALGRGATLGRRRAPSRPIKRTVDALKTGDLTSVASALHNDFEAARMAGVEDALEAKEALLRSGCLGAGMSGSGSAVFGIAQDRAEAERIASSARAEWPWVAVAPTVRSGDHLIFAAEEQ